MSTEILSVVQAAEHAGVEKETIYRAIWRNHLPARRRGNPRTGRLFIELEDLNRWMFGSNYSDERTPEVIVRGNENSRSRADAGSVGRNSRSDRASADKRISRDSKKVAKGY